MFCFWRSEFRFWIAKLLTIMETKTQSIGMFPPAATVITTITIFKDPGSLQIFSEMSLLLGGRVRKTVSIIGI